MIDFDWIKLVMLRCFAKICAAGKQPYCSPPNNPISSTREITYKTLAKICAAGKEPYCSPPNNPISSHL
jgi:hypothetical protein